ncbi:MAG: hypothetical protein H0U49_06345 [Parachlamydiaceae bacterium]|nr:hypothetical protein [Parachlamydiaceae bacterium]
MISKLLILVVYLIFLINCTSIKAIESVSTLERPTVPTEIYGPKDAEIALTLGNGGAGPTCILQALSEDFIVLEGLEIRIAWIQSISRFTLKNLKEKVIDISLTYESIPELQAVQEGWASARSLVFNDHFIIVGPKSNPAGILPSDTPEVAFDKISQKGNFFSRDDLSGTNQRERMIWENIGMRPWENKPEWYITETLFPADALRKSDDENLYTITDRGTLLATQSELSNVGVFVQESESLINRCHAMLQNDPSPIAKKFLDYLKSSRAQSLIANYIGKDKSCIQCCPLFTPAEEDKFLEPNCLEKLGFSPQA